MRQVVVDRWTQGERPFEAPGVGALLKRDPQVPLAGNVRVVARSAEPFRHRRHIGSKWFIVNDDTGFTARRSGHQAGPGCGAVRCGVEVRQAHAFERQRIQVRRGDLPAERAKVGIAQVVGEDEQDVRAIILDCNGVGGSGGIRRRVALTARQNCRGNHDTGQRKGVGLHGRASALLTSARV